MDYAYTRVKYVSLGGTMGEEPKIIMLNGGTDIKVGLVVGAEAHLVQLLGEASSKTGVATLRVVKNASGVPFVAVFVAGKHAGFLSHTDAQGLVPILGTLEQQGKAAGAKATVTASPEGTPIVALSLAAPDRLVDVPRMDDVPSMAQAPQVQPTPETQVVQAAQSPQGQQGSPLVAAGTPQADPPGGDGSQKANVAPGFCITCGATLPPGAQFCPGCGMTTTAASPSQTVYPGSAFPPGALPQKKGWWARRSVLQIVLIALGALILITSVPLAAIAVPTFLGQREKAQDAAAKSLVRNAMTALESCFVDTRTFSVDPDILQYIEPFIDFQQAPSHVVGLDGAAAGTTAWAEESAVNYFGDGITYSVTTKSESGTIWGVYVDKGPGGGNIYVRSRDGEAEVGW